MTGRAVVVVNRVEALTEYSFEAQQWQEGCWLQKRQSNRRPSATDRSCWKVKKKLLNSKVSSFSRTNFQVVTLISEYLTRGTAQKNHVTFIDTDT